jgi:hypothetical protein
LKSLEHKAELQYCKIEDIKESYKTITKLQQSARDIINFYDAAIKKEYQNIMDPKYRQVCEKYSGITKRLLHIVFPNFLKKFNIVPNEWEQLF